MNNSERNVARRYALELILIGIALSKDGDGERVRELLSPEFLAGYGGTNRGLKAIQQMDRQGVADFLALAGVQMLNDEMAVDSILRTFLNDTQVVFDKRQDELKAAIRKEQERAENKLKIAATDSTAVGA